MNFIFLGPPGSGKGTQAKQVCRELNILHLSTGDVLRENVKNGTELGKKAQKFMEAGDLVPDNVIVGMIEDKLKNGELDNGFILDGFPRTVPQAQALKEMFASNHKSIDRAILLDVSDEEVIKRLSGRFYCPTCNAGYNYPAKMPKVEGICDKDGSKLLRRPDDEEDVVKNRLDVYKKQTEPIVEFYRNESILTEVGAERSIEAIFADLLKLTQEFK
ncbi:MAG: adenylate kinase [Candidatus Zixiibacteriota bacterium]|nr:MAG: adenylate kinase [candidate division Zixibacteria bacterium]HDL04083.1 adenylate kinase [candidate division Zixibacteria bacterium]